MAITYSVKRAAEEVGVSESVIRNAIHAGDLAYTQPMVGGKPIRNQLIEPEELERWAKCRAA